MLHLNTLLPVSVLANPQHSRPHLLNTAHLWATASFVLAREPFLCIKAVVSSLSSPEPSTESLRVIVRRTRSPVRGRMRVACRSYQRASASLVDMPEISEKLTLDRKKRLALGVECAATEGWVMLDSCSLWMPCCTWDVRPMTGLLSYSHLVSCIRHPVTNIFVERVEGCFPTPFQH